MGGVILFVGLFIVGEYLLLSNQLATHIWADGFWTISALLAALRCLLTARKSEGKERRAWGFFGAACLSWFIGMLAWDYFELVEQVVTPFPAISDFGFMGFAPLFLIGGFHYASRSPATGETLRRVFDLGLVICATIIGVIIVLYSAVENSTESALYLVAALAYPVLYVSTFLFGVSWLFMRRLGARRRVYLYLLSGIGVHAVVDTLYAFSLLGRTYEAGHVLDPFWLVGFALIYWAAVEGERVAHAETARGEVEDESFRLSISQYQSILPGLALLGALIFAFAFRGSLDSGVLAYTLPFAMAFALLFILGEWGTNRLEQRMAGLALREGERAQRYLDTAQVMLLALDKEGRVTLINRKGETLLGRSGESLKGVDFATAFLAEGDRETFRTFLGQPREQELEISIKLDSGFEPTLLFQAASIDDGVLCSAEDITARKKAEDELRRSNLDLEQFAYLASHDLQEPLRMVSSYVQLITRRYGDVIDEEGREYIGYAEEGAKRMSALIRDLLQYSRVQRQDIAPTPVSSEDAAHAALAMLASDIEATKAEVAVASLPVVLADKTRLSLVFQNLIGNALKYRSPDRTPEVRISAYRDGGEWVFSVKDNGVGIKQEYFERIFGVFQRLNRREDTPGTGIGLSIVQKVVERLGGRVWLESVPEEGTSFYFTLPAADPE